MGKRLGNRLFATYLVIKLLFILNAVGQIYLLESFIGLNHNGDGVLGVTLTKNMIEGKNWQVRDLVQVFINIFVIMLIE